MVNEHLVKMCARLTTVNKRLTNTEQLRGPGVFMKNFQKSTFWLFLIEDIDFKSISIRCFWSNGKILFLAKVIAGQRSAPVCNNIACTIFNPLP